MSIIEGGRCLNQTCCASQLVAIAATVGFIGDILLQIGVFNLNLGGNTGWGLKDYFLHHGRRESAFIAAGMMALFYLIFLRLPSSEKYMLLSLSVFAIILDLIFRIFVIFPSLWLYYDYFNYFWSAVWAVIPMLIPFIIHIVLKKYNRSFI